MLPRLVRVFAPSLFPYVYRSTLLLCSCFLPPAWASRIVPCTWMYLDAQNDAVKAVSSSSCVGPPILRMGRLALKICFDERTESLLPFVSATLRTTFSNRPSHTNNRAEKLHHPDGAHLVRGHLHHGR